MALGAQRSDTVGLVVKDRSAWSPRLSSSGFRQPRAPRGWSVAALWRRAMGSTCHSYRSGGHRVRRCAGESGAELPRGQRRPTGCAARGLSQPSTSALETTPRGPAAARARPRALDQSAAEHAVAVVEHERLARRDRRHRLVERELDLVAVEANDLRRAPAARDGAPARDTRAPTAGRIDQPVHLARDDAAAEQLVARPDDDRAIARAESRRRTSARANPPGSPRRWPIVKRAKPSCVPTDACRQTVRTARARATARRRRAAGE